jgi:Uma2 family endonuclease
MILAAKATSSASTDYEPQDRLWTREEYDKLVDDGYFKGQRVELIEGRVLQMPPQKLPHRTSYELCIQFAGSAFPAGHRICGQLPFRAADGSDPEPDIAVIAGADPRAVTDHPSSAVLIIEVAEASIRHDRRKAKLYSISNVADYWIINLNDRTLEVYRDPIPGGGSPSGPAYATIQILTAEQSITPLAAQAASIKVADLLP